MLQYTYFNHFFLRNFYCCSIKLSEQAKPVLSNLTFRPQTSESNRKDRMSFLLPKLEAVWKFCPSGAILSFSLWLQDSMAPLGQNFGLSFFSLFFRAHC